MRIKVVAHRFENGSWKRWKHVCDDTEVAAVLNSAMANAFSRAFSNVPIDDDYLQAARYIFDRACGPREQPAEGDIRVIAVSVSVVAETQADDIFGHKKSA